MSATRAALPTRRFPIVSTLVVVLAAGIMVWLGVWQLQRRTWKEALLTEYQANLGRPAIAFPRSGAGEDLLFRRATAECGAPTGWTREGGRNARGGIGWRQIATCAPVGGGAPIAVQAGIAQDPNARPSWGGGVVTGYITHAPDHRALIALVFDHRPPPLMLVAAPPVAGLDANPPADLSGVPNNHLAYAVQWFVFAGLALLIYGIALRRRLRG